MAGAEQTPASRPSIQEISGVDTVAKTSGRELIKPEEARERNLQRAFVEILAHAGLPFETAFQVADVAWDVHQMQLEERSKPAPPPREPTPEEIEAQAKWDAMTPEEREARGAKIWKKLEADPDFRDKMHRSVEDFRQGRYYSMAILDYELAHPGRIPKLRVAEEASPEAVQPDA